MSIPNMLRFKNVGNGDRDEVSGGPEGEDAHEEVYDDGSLLLVGDVHGEEESDSQAADQAG